MNTESNKISLLDNAEKIIFVILMMILTIFMFTFIYSAMNLRPAADDYCFGAIVGQYGLAQSAIFFYQTWSGFIFPIFLQILLVGLPLVYLDWSLASAIPFLVSSIVVGAPALIMMKMKNLSFLKIIFLLSLITFTWWTFLWTPEFFGLRESERTLLAYGLTHWQTLNIGYLLTLEILICISLLILSAKKTSSWMLFAAILIGIIVGTSGSVPSLCAFIWSGMAVIFYKLLKKQHQSTMWLSFCFGITTGIMISHFLSPGHLARQQMFPLHMNFNADEINKMISLAFDDTRRFLERSYLKASALFVILMLVPIPVLLKNTFSVDYRKPFFAAICMTLFAMLLTLVTSFSEFFAYKAYWHYSDSLVCIFLSLVLFAFAIGSFMAKWFDGRISKILASFLLIACFIHAAFIQTFANDKIDTRKIAWSSGPASTHGIQDIDDPKGWQRICWNDMMSYRKNPAKRMV